MVEVLSTRLKDETGARYGRLMVLKYSGRAGGSSKHPKFLCACDCGNEVEVTGTALRCGTTRSCGCYQRERASEGNFKHGLNGTLAHKSYYSMLYRCYKEEDPDYSRYGGRGITVCDRWLEGDFRGLENFIEDMGDRPSEKYSLDRIDVNGNYCPENCRWEVRAVQNFNTRVKATNKTGRTGVHFSKNNTFNVKIGFEGKSINVGTYPTFEEACKAREEAELKYYGFVKK